MEDPLNEAFKKQTEHCLTVGFNRPSGGRKKHVNQCVIRATAKTENSGVLAVDPTSSPLFPVGRSGDRVRMQEHKRIPAFYNPESSPAVRL
jgi:putative protein kinase ArgK-like GTPase of G3E family